MNNEHVIRRILAEHLHSEHNKEDTYGNPIKTLTAQIDLVVHQSLETSGTTEFRIEERLPIAAVSSISHVDEKKLRGR
ncbi:hypothetical protein Tco_1523346 [Tanacetum coccineum]